MANVTQRDLYESQAAQDKAVTAKIEKLPTRTELWVAVVAAGVLGQVVSRVPIPNTPTIPQAVLNLFPF